MDDALFFEREMGLTRNVVVDRPEVADVMVVGKVCGKTCDFNAISRTNHRKGLVARHARCLTRLFLCVPGTPRQSCLNARQHIDGKGVGPAIKRGYSKRTPAILGKEALVEDTLAIRKKYHDGVAGRLTAGSQK